MKIFCIALAIIFINIFFGYWRAGTRRYSPEWIFAIHTPVPVAIVLRLLFLGWNWLLLPVFVLVFAAGQYAGGWIRHFMARYQTELGPFLLTDLVRVVASRKTGDS